MDMLKSLEEFTYVSVFVRLLFATLSGALIGLERSSRGKNAGVRTFSLVCLGAALVMIINEFLIAQYSTGDPARLGAQVISGVGFLGVGTIIVTGRNHVKGLTTAATLWTTACIGIAIGSGYIAGALMAMLMILFIMTVLSFVSRITDDYTSHFSVYIELADEVIIDDIYQYVNEHGYRILSIDKQKKQTLHSGDIALLVKLDTKKHMKHEPILAELHVISGVHYIEDLH